MTKVKFENQAKEGFRLYADIEKDELPYIIRALEINAHGDAPSGHIMLQEYRYRPQGNMEICVEKIHLFFTYKELKEFMDNKYGTTNLDDFEGIIKLTMEEKLNNWHMKKWKKIVA